MSKEKVPDRILIGKGDREIYEKLKSINFFQEKDNKDIFMMALIWGFHEGKRKKVQNAETFFLLNTLEDADEAIMNAIAVYENKDIDIFLSKKELYKIIQEYGSAGIRLLESQFFEKDDGNGFIRELESILLKKFNNIN